jgi:hypothetical protein
VDEQEMKVRAGFTALMMQSNEDLEHLLLQLLMMVAYRSGLTPPDVASAMHDSASTPELVAMWEGTKASMETIEKTMKLGGI